MTSTSAETSTDGALPAIRPEDLDPRRVLRRIDARNRTKADSVVYRSPEGAFLVKDYAARPWIVRHTLGRWLIARECRAYAAAAGAAGLPRFRGRTGRCALAVEWIEASRLADAKAREVPTARFERLEEIVAGLHRRGVALVDLNYRDVLLSEDGSVHVVDLAAAWVLGSRPGRLRRRLFEHFRAADLFAVARLRARFTGQPQARAVAEADPRVVAWHRRARRIKWCWDRLRGAPRLPPVDDHWRF